MDAHDQNFLVVGTVENPDVSALGHVFHGAPHVVMIEFFGRGRFERKHLAALRVDSRHDVLDHAVFSSSVHGLKDQQERPAILRVQFVLQFGELLDALFQKFVSFFLGLDAGSVRRIVILEAEMLSVFYAKRLYQLAAYLHSDPRCAKCARAVAAVPRESKESTSAGC